MAGDRLVVVLADRIGEGVGRRFGGREVALLRWPAAAPWRTGEAAERERQDRASA